ncbi:MAG: hypothetical protein H6Q73_2748 [Firmicutes bacterium]|nr:hypothetical protein [Bacillota bacterium]
MGDKGINDALNIMTDFERGYYYAKQRNEASAGKNSLSEMLDLVEIFSEVDGYNAELAKGMAAYYAEQVRMVRKKCSLKKS